jgi:hypothetical protein
MCSIFQTYVPFKAKILIRTEGPDVFLFSVLSSSMKGPVVRWLQYVCITPLSEQYLEVSGLLPFLQVKGPWYLSHRRVGGSFGVRELKTNAIKQFMLS